MAVLRKFDDGSLTIVDIPKDIELEFYNLNKDSGLYIYIDDENLPESKYGYYKLDPTTNEVIVDIEKELATYKEEKIKELNQHTTDYILTYYPIEKQNADNQQKDYFGTALLLIRNTDTDETTPNLTVDQIYQQIGIHVNEILDQGKTLSEIVSQYPEQEQFYWEQLIKAGVRKAWTIRCVYVFNQIKNQISNAQSIEELDSINTQSPDFPPFPEL